MATPTKKTFLVDAGTEVFTGKCDRCSGVVFVTISKSGTAYYNCYNRSDATGHPCQAHARFGGKDSANIRRKYLESTGAIVPVKIVPVKIEIPKSISADVEPVEILAAKSEFDDYGI